MMAASTRCVMRNYFHQLTCFRLHFRKLYSSDISVTKSDVQGEEEIVIPYRIHRGPTDILKALASTVSKDYTAPHYKYEDDPYFIPSSNVAKRSFALSKEAGKKAARYFLEKYPELFQCNKSDPVIKAFEPPKVITENDDVTEDTLETCIQSFDVTNSITAYQLLKNKGVKLKQETMQQLLELLCFYNSTQPANDDYYEEKWYTMKDMKKRPVFTWMNNGMADKVFQDMEKDGAAYCAMIQGTAKYFHIERALELYEEMKSKNLKGCTEMYNSLLSVVPYIKEDNDMRWDTAMKFVQSMNEEGLKPDLYTMNALLGIIVLNRRWNKRRDMALGIFGEMRKFGIEPSLASYYYLLEVFGDDRSYESVLTEIMKILDGRELSIRHPDDTLFFFKAMSVCNNFDSKDIAYSINALLESGRNSSLMGCAMYESLYFRNFFKLLCRTEDFDKFMEVYYKYVPSSYTPEPSLTLEIVRTIDICGSYKYLPQMCSDMIMFEQTEREDIISELLRIAASQQFESELQTSIINMVWNVFESLVLRMERNVCRLQWTGNLLGDMLKVFLNGKDLEKSWAVMQKFQEWEQYIIGYPEVDCFVKFCSIFLEAEEFKKVKFCVKFATDTCFPTFKDNVETIANDLFDKNILDEKYRPQVEAILGKDEFENHEKKESENFDENKVEAS